LDYRRAIRIFTVGTIFKGRTHRTPKNSSNKQMLKEEKEVTVMNLFDKVANLQCQNGWTTDVAWKLPLQFVILVQNM
jgi:hypothetical protein